MWTKRVFEDMSKLEHERDVSELKTELQEMKNKNRDLQNRVQSLYKEIRCVSDSILPQELEIASLRKEKHLLEKKYQNVRDTMEDILLKLPNVCKVSFCEYKDGTSVLNFEPLS